MGPRGLSQQELESRLWAAASLAQKQTEATSFPGSMTRESPQCHGCTESLEDR